jgi:hypothetical protein
MSTKTTFKRIALVAVAALGLGVLSVAPSQAATGTATLTVTAGSASVTTGASNETTTAATININGLLSASLDSYTISLVKKSGPASSSAVPFKLAVAETTTLGTVITSKQGVNASALGYRFGGNGGVVAYDSSTAFTTAVSDTYTVSAGVGYAGATFALLLGDSSTARVAGTYVYTALVQAYEGGSATPKTGGLQVVDLTFTINDTAANVALTSGTIDAGRTTAWLNSGSTWSTASDSSVSVVSTASSTDVAVLKVSTFNADANPTPESVTVTVTGAGVVGTGGVFGKSLKVIGTGGVTTFTIRADGTAGLGSIVVATTSKTFPAKTVNFFAKAASTFTAPAVARPVIDTTATNDVVRVTAADASGNAWTGAAYIYATSAASALIAGSETPVACTFDAADNRHECPVTGKANGTASFKIIDAATVALATATSAEVSVRVSTATAGSVKLAFDKSSYVPGERAVITAQVLDTAGLAMPAVTLSNLFATGAITSNLVLTAVSSNVLTSVSGAVAAANSSSDPLNPANAGHVTYVVTMPQTTGTVTLTAKGGASLAIAGQVAVTASAEVNNPSADAATDAANEATDAANAATDAALAAADAADAATAAAQDASDAVAALSATVAKLVASLKAQITSLTNLVIKIQKKVKA